MIGVDAFAADDASCRATRALRAAGRSAPWALVADARDLIRYVTPGLEAALLPARAARGAGASSLLRPVVDDDRLAVEGFRRSDNLAVAAWRAPLGSQGRALYVAIDAAARPEAERAAVAALGAMRSAGDGPMGGSARMLARRTFATARAQVLTAATALLAEHSAGDVDSAAAALGRLGTVVAAASAADAGAVTDIDAPGGPRDLRDTALVLQIADCIEAVEAARAARAVLCAVTGRWAGPLSPRGCAAALRDELIRNWDSATRLLTLAETADRSLGEVVEAIRRVGDAVAHVAQSPGDAARPDGGAGAATPAAPAPASLDAVRASRAARAR